MRSMIRVICGLLLGVLVYLNKIEPVMVNNEWVPSWAPHIPTIRIVVYMMWGISLTVLVYLRFLEKKGKNHER